MRHSHFVLAFVLCAAPAMAQEGGLVQPSLVTSPAMSVPAAPAPPPAAKPATPPAMPAGITPPADYVIGPDDGLAVVFWRDADMSAEAMVRPDGKISLPLLNDVQAAGLTPAQLREQITEAARQYVADPTVSVIVKQINSRKVFITGQVNKPGAYPLNGPTTVMQLIAVAGGILEFADGDNILVIRTEKGAPTGYRVNYKWVLEKKNLRQNIELKPGDTVIVP